MSKLEHRTQDYPHIRDYFWLSNGGVELTGDAYHYELTKLLDDLDRGMSDTMEGYADYLKLRKKAKKVGRKWLEARYLPQPQKHVPTWPDTPFEHEKYAAWQTEAQNGNTLLGFRDWLARNR
jgi:hypothetical protein